MEWADIIYGIVAAIIVSLGAWIEWRRMGQQDKHEARARTESGAETQARLARLEAAQEHVERLTRLEEKYDALAERIANQALEQLVVEAVAEPRPARGRSRK